MKETNKIKSVLPHANDDDAKDARFQIVVDVCRAFGAHLAYLYMTPNSGDVAFDPLAGMGAQAAIFDGLCVGETALLSRVEARLVHDLST
jgi:hypothetical protein